MRKYFILLFAFSISCKPFKSATATEKMNFDSDFGDFTMDLPIGWKYIKEDGVPAFIGGIIIDKIDTLQFDYGFWSSRLKGDSLWRIWDNDYKYDFTKKSTSKIDGFYFYCVFPEDNDAKASRLYIDSLDDNGGTITHFEIYGTNLSRENQILFLQATKTLKFKRYSHKRKDLPNWLKESAAD